MRSRLGRLARTAALSLAILAPAAAHGAPSPRPVDGNLSFPCAFLGACPERAVPGGPDRDVRPFARSLGRPCAWRERPTPEGPRRVRACW